MLRFVNVSATFGAIGKCVTLVGAVSKFVALWKERNCICVMPFVMPLQRNLHLSAVKKLDSGEDVSKDGDGVSFRCKRKPLGSPPERNVPSS